MNGHCGSCYAGILIMNDTEIQRCDECRLFETDEDAAAAVEEILSLFHRLHHAANWNPENPRTVTDSLDLLKTQVMPRIAMGESLIEELQPKKRRAKKK